MDELTLLSAFDYQRFQPNRGLELRIQTVYEKYLAGGAIIPDEELDVSAAGEIKPFPFGNGLQTENAEGIDRDDR